MLVRGELTNHSSLLHGLGPLHVKDDLKTVLQFQHLIGGVNELPQASYILLKIKLHLT